MSRPLRILSLDGGGIRGKSSLLILEAILEKIRDIQSLKHVPRPCQYFDLIGGTSTGGIIAIMLGRLEMTVDECIAAYKELAEKAFTAKHIVSLPGSPRGAFSATALESAMKHVIRQYCIEEECVAQRRQGISTLKTCSHSEQLLRHDHCVKTVILAITKDDIDARPTLFRTYDRSTSFRDCSIWQVARATSAATTFFKSIKCGRDEIEFIDAGFGYNNPCGILIEEAKHQFPGASQLQVLSIGTGLGSVVTVKDKRMSIINALKKMATSSKKVSDQVEAMFRENPHYYRFNVDRGLEDITLADWKKDSRISSHTHNFLKEQYKMVEKCASCFATSAWVGKCKQVLEHNSIVNAVMFSPNSQQLASASQDLKVRIWNTKSGECERILEGHTDQVEAVSWSTDGRWLASASWDMTVRIWNSRSGECERILKGHIGRVEAVSWAPDGRWLASASWDKTVRVWNQLTGQCNLVLRGHNDDVNSVSWSGDSRRLASASSDRSIRVWDLVSAKCLHILTSHTDDVCAIAFSLNGQWLASGSWDRTVRLWNPITGICEQSLDRHDGEVSAVAFSPDSRYLASASWDRSVKVWDITTGKMHVFSGHSAEVQALAFSADNNQLASASRDTTIIVWKMQQQILHEQE